MPLFVDYEDSAMAITFRHNVENDSHAGNKQVGKVGERGLHCKELEEFKSFLVEVGCAKEKVEVYDLRKLLPISRREEAKEASVLVAKGGVPFLLDTLLGPGDPLGGDFDHSYGALKSELGAMPVDQKAFMYGRVVNKNARWNNCIADEAAVGVPAEGKPTVVSYASLPVLSILRRLWGRLISPAAVNLNAETNFYHSNSLCGIGWHGDEECVEKVPKAQRGEDGKAYKGGSPVIGLNVTAEGDFGERKPKRSLFFQWFQHGQPVGEMLELELEDGDMYAMSEWATGAAWKMEPKSLTLRHAAGCEKFTRAQLEAIKKRKRKRS